jgi:nickel transport protein
MIVIMIGLVLAGMSEQAIAHSVLLKHQSVQALEIQANYDSGEPMKNAQVTVYAPNTQQPWLKGSTNDRGYFAFVPDRTQPGTWSVKVRSEGHGNIINIPLVATSTASIDSASDKNMATEQGTLEPVTASSAVGFTPLQKAIMATAVIWGFMGTALFFQRRQA